MASDKLMAGDSINLIEDIQKDEYFDCIKDKMPNIFDPAQYIGLCPEQVNLL